MTAPKLSICIATYKRARFIGETLDSIMAQVTPETEVVVVDGASPDETAEVMARYQAKYPEIRYFREQKNSGVDGDYDNAVGYAKGEYCWLMTDDDLLKSNAIKTVLSALESRRQLFVVNSEVKNIDLTRVFQNKRLVIDSDKNYESKDIEAFFSDATDYMSFIGCVVINRDFWLTRNRTKYYGSLFIHVGVIFQNPPVKSVAVIAEPLITIRYGNAMWTPRSFEIWMFKWPSLIWSFADFSDLAKRKICREKPYTSPKILFYNRALGVYNWTEYKKIAQKKFGKLAKLIAFALSVFPASLANLLAIFYCIVNTQPRRMALNDLVNSRGANFLSRKLVRAVD